jgi:predicted ATPase/class 3 adenylate cyclase
MHQPPTGTITFLFTDIEGSTRLWEDHPDAMRLALERHDKILREAIHGNGGFIFRTAGDAFLAAFATAPEALMGALTAQLGLAAEPWAAETPLRVRMALHVGAAEKRDGDYFGQPLNRVARLLSAGHGGQTLLSLAAQELTRDHMPADTSLQDLGPHRLKDLTRPETVFQLLHPSLPNDFPRLRSIDNPGLPNNLPPQPTSFIGRDTELAEVKALFATTRLLTLAGIGGTGKSRLSLQVAADLLDQFPDGVWLVELAPLSDPALVPQAVAQVLNVGEEPGKTPAQTLEQWLRPKHLLLILDNCEHLLPACAALAANLLRNCPQVHILGSSREPLNVTGEQTYRVPSLSLPDPKQAQTVESVSQYEAVALFIERAQSVHPSFTVTEANAPAVAQVCVHLDGIPLAIELAAARVRSLSPEEINTRLSQRFRLLTGGSRDVLPRQQTLRALIDWSYDLLTDQEKALLCRLSVFAGGWTMETSEAVCSGTPVEDFEVLDLLTALVDKSLVAAVPTKSGTRYHLLETVRQYAHDRLREAGEEAAIRARHRDEFLRLAERARPEIQGPGQQIWLDRLEEEHDNLRAALDWCLEDPEGAQPGLRLAADLFFLWWMRGYFTEGQRQYAAALARPGAQARTAARARTLGRAGGLISLYGDADARPLFEEGLAIAREIGDRKIEANLWCNLGDIATGNDLPAARTALERSLEIHRELGNRPGIAHAALLLGNVAHSEGDDTAARALHEESLAINRALGNPQKTGHALWCLARDDSAQGDYPRVRALLEECIALFRGLKDRWGLSAALALAGAVALEAAYYDQARPLLIEHLQQVEKMGMRRSAPWVLRCLGRLAVEHQEWARAARLLGAAGGLQSAPADRPPAPPIEEADADPALSLKEVQAVRATRQALGPEVFAAPWSEGWTMSLEQVTKYVLAGTDAHV